MVPVFVHSSIRATMSRAMSPAERIDPVSCMMMSVMMTNARWTKRLNLLGLCQSTTATMLAIATTPSMRSRVGSREEI